MRLSFKRKLWLVKWMWLIMLIVHITIFTIVLAWLVL